MDGLMDGLTIYNKNLYKKLAPSHKTKVKSVG